MVKGAIQPRPAFARTTQGKSEKAVQVVKRKKAPEKTPAPPELVEN